MRLFKTFKSFQSFKPFKTSSDYDLNGLNCLNVWNSLHLTSARGIGERFVRHCHDFVLTANHFAQINVLDRVVCFG